MSVWRCDLYGPMFSRLPIPGDKVEHDFDPGIFTVLECNPNLGFITVMPEGEWTQNLGITKPPISLPRPRQYPVGELRYVDY